MSAIATRCLAQILDSLRREYRITQRDLTAVGENAACFEILKYEAARRMENVDDAHAFAAITSSTAMEQPRASAPFARPLSS